MCDMDGKEIRECAIKDLVATSGQSMEFISANRAAMQEKFLKHLLGNNAGDKQESDILKCGIEVIGYEDDESNDYVHVKLSDGTSVNGSALLACDGIHSAVRKQLISNLNPPMKDEFHDCKTICWWGKMDGYKPGTPFYKAFQASQQRQREGVSFVWALSDSKRPGCFMAAPSSNTFMWAFFVKSDNVPTKFSDDLTRRGGIKLDETSKQALDKLVANRGDLIRLAIEETPAAAITKVGLFDRENLDLPYSNRTKRVGLLGDAAHPQSPFMGQGVNQAITDAYVCGTRIGRSSTVQEAIRQYDSSERRTGVNGIIQKARSYGDMSVSKKWFVNSLFYIVAAYMPLSWLWTDMIDADKPNHDFVHQLDKDLSAVLA